VIDVENSNLEESYMKRLIASLAVTLMGGMTTLTGSTVARDLSIHPTIKTSLLAEPAIIVSPSQPTAQQTSKLSAEVEAVVNGNNAFALDLYRQLRDREGNLFFSPYSTSTALAMTYVGAKGQTATEMSKVLHFSLEPESLHPAFASLLGMLNTKDKQGFQLNTANRLWGQQEYNFLKPFKQVTQDYYGAALEEVDFINATEETRRTINKWVEQQTQEKIQNLIASDILTSLTRIVLTNAIYFKATWVNQFDPAYTKNKFFTIAPGQQVDVPTMSLEASVGYAEFDNLQVLELLYSGEETSMVILLPKNVDGLAALEQQLTQENLKNWLSAIEYDECPERIHLPKFRVNSQFEFKQVLSKMGMGSAFNDSADFSGMNGRKDLFLANVIHKTFVDVNELGTEATASTEATGVSRCGGESFNADRPFIFLIRHIPSGSILFMGRIVNPLSRDPQ
jgi:serpin B